MQKKSFPSFLEPLINYSANTVSKKKMIFWNNLPNHLLHILSAIFKKLNTVLFCPAIPDQKQEWRATPAYFLICRADFGRLPVP
jgi:hypothetical protein